MVRKCIIKSCATVEGTGRKLFSFPKEGQTRSAWLLAAGKNDFKSSWRICEIHFGPEQWEKVRVDGERRLKLCAVPTGPAVDENTPSHCAVVPLDIADHSYSSACKKPTVKRKAPLTDRSNTNDALFKRSNEISENVPTPQKSWFAGDHTYHQNSSTSRIHSSKRKQKVLFGTFDTDENDADSTRATPVYPQGEVASSYLSNERRPDLRDVSDVRNQIAIICTPSPRRFPATSPQSDVRRPDYLPHATDSLHSISVGAPSLPDLELPDGTDRLLDGAPSPQFLSGTIPTSDVGRPGLPDATGSLHSISIGAPSLPDLELPDETDRLHDASIGAPSLPDLELPDGTDRLHDASIGAPSLPDLELPDGTDRLHDASIGAPSLPDLELPDGTDRLHDASIGAPSPQFLPRTIPTGDVQRPYLSTDILYSDADVDAVPLLPQHRPADIQVVVQSDTSTRHLTCDELLTLVDEKRKEIAGLEQKLGAAVRLSEKFQRQYAAVLKTNTAYRTKIKRLRKSNDTLREKLRGRMNSCQLASLARKSPRGMKWDSNSLRQGLTYKMKWGTQGYSEFVKKYPIFPSARTLQSAVRHMEFNSGILQEVFDALRCDVPKMEPSERESILVFDEMAIKAGEVFDISTQRTIGASTFNPHHGLGKKALVFMLAGVQTRWKCSVAYYFTSNASADKKRRNGDDNEVGNELKAIILDILKRAEGVGLRISTIISDMGSDNRAMWKAFGVGYSPGDSTVRCSIPHPERPSDRLWILPDSVHLFKNMLSTLNSNKVIYLPEGLLTEECLPAREVRIQHLENLLEFERNFELKTAYRLKEEILHCENQYAKMKVGSARAVFNKRTEAALRAKSACDGGEESNETTAYFVSLVSRWFDLMTNRGRKLALSKSNPEAYADALQHITRTAAVFRQMRIGENGNWKPIQTGVLMSCEGIIQLQEYYLNERDFTFLLTGRFTQDCLENFFSLIRFRQPTPNAVNFKQNLKVITLTQMCLTSNNSSYTCDSEEGDVDDLKVDFISFTKQLADAKRREKEIDSLMEAAAIHVPQVKDSQLNSIDPWERFVIYDIAGSVLRSLKKLNVSICSVCFASVTLQGQGKHPYSMILLLREYKEDCLIAVSDDCFKAIMKAEVTFRMTRDVLKDLKHVNSVAFLVENLKYVWDGANVPSCHDITTKILHRFLTMRFKMCSVQKSNRKVIKSVKYCSKTMGMHAAVE